MNTLVSRKVIEYYSEGKNGVIPFLRWLGSLGRREARIIHTRLIRIVEGNYGDYKSVGEGVLELRFHQGYRIYFTERGNTIVILLCGGDKSSQEKDIERAKEYKRILDGQKNSH